MRRDFSVCFVFKALILVSALFGIVKAIHVFASQQSVHLYAQQFFTPRNLSKSQESF